MPLFPGKRYEDWELTGSRRQDIDEVRPIRDEIGRRVQSPSRLARRANNRLRRPVSRDEKRSTSSRLSSGRLAATRVNIASLASRCRVVSDHQRVTSSGSHESGGGSHCELGTVGARLHHRGGISETRIEAPTNFATLASKARGLLMLAR